jgi:hypothetical protein
MLIWKSLYMVIDTFLRYVRHNYHLTLEWKRHGKPFVSAEYGVAARHICGAGFQDEDSGRRVRNVPVPPYSHSEDTRCTLSRSVCLHSVIRVQQSQGF